MTRHSTQITVAAASDGSFIRHFIAVRGDRVLRPENRRLWLSRSSDGTRLMVSGMASRASVHEISAFETPIASVDTKRQRVLHELIACQRVHGGKLVPSATEEWLERWEECCRVYGRPPLDPIKSPALQWAPPR